MDASYILAPPNPSALIESLRAFGYTPQAAIADLIDNSISAGARNIQLDAHWDGEDSWIRLIDDGAGMSEAVLNEAMRLGGMGPLELRSELDLGRFGLGLKTASFSQCRRLTVASHTLGGTNAVRRWDLDYVGSSGEWRLLTDPSADAECLIDHVANQINSGTTVLWQAMDRIVKGANVNNSKAKNQFLEMLREIETHLAMVFHRFLTGQNRIALFVGANQVKPWDPFMANPGLSEELSPESLWFGGQEIRVRPYVLPHHSRLSRKQHEAGSGPKGWNGQQGFYVYRNRRLLVAGDWLGLPFKKEEHYKLARIQVDLPNSLDAEWDIDVRKSRARPPGILRDDLRRIAMTTRQRAVAVYRHRGKLLTNRHQTEIVRIWNPILLNGKIHYKLNREHPSLERLFESYPGDRGKIESILRLVEETVPIATISIDHSEHPEQQRLPFEDVDQVTLLEAGFELLKAFIGQGSPANKAAELLAATEPFNMHPELIAVLIQQLESE